MGERRINCRKGKNKARKSKRAYIVNGTKAVLPERDNVYSLEQSQPRVKIGRGKKWYFPLKLHPNDEKETCSTSNSVMR